MSEKPPIRLTHQAYTIGWICALPIEGGAASFMLDEEHADLVNLGSDTNSYWLGSISGHNVAIACLPSGSYGNNSAAAVAARMISTFPNIKVGLMVGIGGGIPSNVRLGDVVISQSKNGHNAVIQWDMGKTEEGGKFKRTGSLNNPPTAVMTALSKFQANSVRSRQKIKACLEGLKSREEAKAFLKSDSMKDPLDATLGAHDTMAIHYGLIASGNQVIKDAATRDRLNADYDGDLLCFEMEAAGLMNDFPCLVIRGICDYSDEHKNKVWQEYAAAVAAACAKSFLSVLPASEITGMKTIHDFVPSSFLQDVKKIFWGDKKEDATPPAVSEKILASEASEKMNDQALPTQTDKPIAGDTGAQSKDTKPQKGSPTQSSQPSQPILSPSTSSPSPSSSQTPPPLADRGYDTQQEMGTNTQPSQHELKQQRDSASELDSSPSSQSNEEYSHPPKSPPEAPQYRVDHSQMPLSQGQFKGNNFERSDYGGETQGQNGYNSEGQPTQPESGNYSPGAPGLRDAAYQATRYSSPANDNSNNASGQYIGISQEQYGDNLERQPGWPGNSNLTAGALDPRNAPYQMSPYQSLANSDSNNIPGSYNGSYGGNPQVQNGNNVGGQPTWSGNGSYSPQTPGPRDAAYQTPPYQSPVNKNTPGQNHGNYSGVPQDQNSLYPQTPPSTWSRNGSYTIGAPNPQDSHYQTPPYQSPVYSNNSQVSNQYDGNYTGNLHDQNGGNSQTLPTWSGNRGYTPVTARPQDNVYQMSLCQSPGYNGDASPPGQYNGYGTAIEPTVPYGYSQNSPAQTPGYSGNHYQNGPEAGQGNYHDGYSGNNGILVGGNGGPYNARPRLNDPQIRQALFQAIESRDVSYVEQLLRDGADPDMRDLSGCTLLWRAAQNGHLAIVRLLLQYPADDSVLLLAVEAGTCDGRRRDGLLGLLISHGALGAISGSDEYSGNRSDQELAWWRHTLVGEWTGSYNYQPPSSVESMGFHIGQVFREAPRVLRKGLILFSGRGEDTVAPFVVYGQVMPGRSVRFVKLYPAFGWTYQGRIMGDEDGGWCLQGQWRKKFSGPPGGHFMLKSWSRGLQTLY
ncbi:hypothetical protein MKX08_007754 [Trichoderma sp. CBMAI-0020]|nr:hypothetical protein MKX08_007754 [Trichoderma sp. CBMAI-0020]